MVACVSVVQLLISGAAVSKNALATPEQAQHRRRQLCGYVCAMLVMYSAAVGLIVMTVDAWRWFFGTMDYRRDTFLQEPQVFDTRLVLYAGVVAITAHTWTDSAWVACRQGKRPDSQRTHTDPPTRRHGCGVGSTSSSVDGVGGGAGTSVSGGGSSIGSVASKVGDDGIPALTLSKSQQQLLQHQHHHQQQQQPAVIQMSVTPSTATPTPTTTPIGAIGDGVVGAGVAVCSGADAGSASTTR